MNKDYLQTRYLIKNNDIHSILVEKFYCIKLS